jgi:hypothetical protein
MELCNLGVALGPAKAGEFSHDPETGKEQRALALHPLFS